MDENLKAAVKELLRRTIRVRLETVNADLAKIESQLAEANARVDGLNQSAESYRTLVKELNAAATFVEEA